MNKKIKIIFIAIILIFMILMFSKKCEAADLDEIINYTTTVSPRDDGTLDIRYHIEWKVLDSTTEGPLEWVKIGIPNQHVDEIKKISKNISKIKYLSSGGNYVRIDFDKKYKAGEIVTFEFSIHQSYMYTIDNSSGKVSYKFTPGWFSDIKVDQAVIKWKAGDIESHNGKQAGDYIVWTKKLAKGEKITAQVEYSIGRFQLDYKKQQSSAKSGINSIVFITVLLVIIYVAIIVIQIVSPTYYRHGGYGYYGGYYPYYHHHHHHYGGFGGGSFGGGSSGGGGSSCACACACAGGGRAGCAKKDFYGTNLKISKISKI